MHAPLTTAGAPLAASFFDRDVVEVARELLGCWLLVDGVGGPIVETEAYHQREPACHAFAGPTPRAAVLFGSAGTIYVYRAYGMHDLVNVVCEGQGTGAAVLIRAIQPVSGLAQMMERRDLTEPRRLCAGPGRLCQALSITRADNGSKLGTSRVTLLAPATPPDPSVHQAPGAPRVGITRAAELPWRFLWPGSPFVSLPKPPRA